MTHCNEHLQVKLYGSKGLLHDSLCHTTASMMRLIFLLIFILFYLVGDVSRAESKYNEGQGNEWNWDA